MAGIEEFRALAAADRAAAEEATLPHRRALLEASAERWEEMVRKAADTASRAAANEIDREAARVEHERQGNIMGRQPRAEA